MSLEETGTLHPNREAGMAYLKSEIVADSACPLTLGSEFTAAIVPHRAVVLLDETESIDYPIHLTIRDPDGYGGDP